MAISWVRLLVLARFLVVAATKPSVLSLDLQRHPKTKSIDTRHNKRSTISAALEQISESLLGPYFVNVSFGTPPQEMRLFVDAGTADTWLNSANSSYCALTANGCSNYSTYDRSLSSSYKFISSGWELSYADGSSESGDYISDNMTISGVTVNSIQFAVANITQSAYGILGLGYAVQEVTVFVNGTQPYPNVPQALANLGVINSNAYSIWLNDPEANPAGNLLFGGVDTDKYTGELRSISIVPQKSSTADFNVPLTELRFGDNIIFSDQNFTARVNSATSFTYLPENVTNVLFPLVGAQYDEQVGAAVIDCAQAENATTLSFTLSWPVVNVTMKELVIPLSTDNNGKTSCMFGIASGSDDFIILGETFLRSAYVVYNLANNELSIAQTNFNATSSNIVEITNGVDGVPGAIRAPKSTAATTAVSTPVSTTFFGTNTAQSSHTPRPISGGAKAGIAIGVVIGVALLGLATFLVWRRSKRRRAVQQSTPTVEDYSGKPELSAEEKKPDELAVSEPAELPGHSPQQAEVSELHGSVPPILELENHDIQSMTQPPHSLEAS